MGDRFETISKGILIQQGIQNDRIYLFNFLRKRQPVGHQHQNSGTQRGNSNYSGTSESMNVYYKHI